MSRAMFVLHNKTVRTNARRALDAAPDDATVEIKPGRTLEQSALMWTLASEIAANGKLCGQRLTPHQWVAVFIHEISHKLQFLPTLDGSGCIPYTPSSSQLTRRRDAQADQPHAQSGAPWSASIRTGGKRHELARRDRPPPATAACAQAPVPPRIQGPARQGKALFPACWHARDSAQRRRRIAGVHGKLPGCAGRDAGAADPQATKMATTDGGPPGPSAEETISRPIAEILCLAALKRGPLVRDIHHWRSDRVLFNWGTVRKLIAQGLARRDGDRVYLREEKVS